MDIPYTSKPRPDTGLYNAKLGIWLFLASEVMLFGALFSAYILLRVGAAPGTWPVGLLNVPLGFTNTLVLICSSVTVVLGWASLKMNKFEAYRKYQTITVACAAIFMVIKSFEYRDKFTHYEVIMKDGTVIDGHLGEQTKDYIVITHPKVTKPGEKAEAGQVEHRAAAASHDHAAGGEHSHAGAAAEADHPHLDQMKISKSETKRIQNYGPWHNTYLAIYFTLTGLHALHVLGGALVIGYILWPGASMWKSDPERYTNRVEVSGLFWHFVDLVWIFLFPILYLL